MSPAAIACCTNIGGGATATTTSTTTTATPTSRTTTATTTSRTTTATTTSRTTTTTATTTTSRTTTATTTSTTTTATTTTSTTAKTATSIHMQTLFLSMGMCWALCFLSSLVGLSVGGACPEYTVPKTVDTSLHVAYLYQRVVLGSLTECVTHCLRGAKCKSLAYTFTRECKLFTKSREDDPSLVISEIGTYYVSRSELPQDIVGKCSGHACAEDALCVEKDSAYHCIPVYGGKRCSSPPGVTNAVVDFADPDSYPWGTGDTVKFNCTPGTPTGPPVMTCMDIGVWSYMFAC